MSPGIQSKITYFLFSLLLLAFNNVAWSLDISKLRAQEIVSFSSPNYRNEVCLIPNHNVNSHYSERDLKIENQLCHLDLYGLTADTNRVAVCPKTGSTNPGVNLFVNKADLKFPDQPVNCQIRDKSLSLIAKHKQSISCSYTPSILMYYHLSRRLGGILNVPVSVVRTIDKEEHLKWTKQALSYFPETSNELIYQNWKHYLKAHGVPETYPNVFTSDQRFIYGALLLNPQDENYYGEVSGKGPYETRVERFQKQPPFLKVSDQRSIDQINTDLDLQGKVQNLVQMTDMSNMILMDQLLNQADRVGNIHYQNRYYSYENGRLENHAKPFPGSLTIKQMIIQDNDCGIIKENMFKKNSVLEKVSHMSPTTYHAFLDWTKELEQPETIDFLKREVLLTQKDLYDTSAGVVTNANAIKRLLVKKCRAGTLKLDLYPETIDRPYQFNPADCEQ